jgi:hypothetical protein
MYSDFALRGDSKSPKIIQKKNRKKNYKVQLLDSLIFAFIIGNEIEKGFC